MTAGFKNPPRLLTHPANNPPDDDAPAQAGKALRTARLVIALGLIIGVGVFGVLTAIEINDARNAMLQPAPQPGPANPFGVSGGTIGGEPQRLRLPGDLDTPAPSDPLLALGQNPGLIPIDHHPGRFKPFLRADAYLQPPYREPVVGGMVVEACAYQTEQGDPQQAYEHYNTLALKRGMKQLHKRDTPPQRPGGVMAAWADESTRLYLNAWPGTPEPTPAPVRPKTPLKWVVKYSYPVPTDTE